MGLIRNRFGVDLVWSFIRLVVNHMEKFGQSSPTLANRDGYNVYNAAVHNFVYLLLITYFETL